MPILILRRDTTLSDQERAAMPPGATILQGHGDQVARYDHTAGTADLVGLAFALGQAVPGAHLDVRGIVERGAPSTPRAAAPAPTSGDAPAAPAGDAAPAAPAGASAAGDPWKLIKAGDYGAAEAALMGKELDGAGRDAVRKLLNSTDPEKVALSCRIAAATNWKSYATSMRRLLSHADVRVRRDAATAIGRLGGPSLALQLERMADDPSPEVREAAAHGLAEIAARQG